jgi:hypothetical protein
MTTIPQVSQAMQALLTTSAEAASTLVGWLKRPDKAVFTASTFVQTLVFGWLAQPDATLEQLSQMAARVGVDVSPQAIDQRFTPSSAALLQEVLAARMQQLIAADPVALPILQRFTAVRIHDSTTITLPDSLATQWAGCGGSSADGTSAALKCGVQLAMLTGALCHLDLADGRAADRGLPMQRAALPPGSLRLADLGFYDRGVLAATTRDGGYWISKLPTNTVLRTGRGPSIPLVEWVTALGDVAQHEAWVELGKERRLRARILVQRVPQEVADQRGRRLRKEAQDKGRQPSAAALALAAWTILITNVPTTLLSLAETLVVIRIRWQIELLFKLWKSYGKLDTWRTANPQRILCEVYAKLIAMVVQHWCMLTQCWAFADRSLVKAAQVVRAHAVELAGAQGCAARLAAILTTIQRVLARTSRIAKRRTQPSTYQLLLALTTIEPQA